MKIKVLVSLKEGVLDPQAKAIFHALHSHGFSQIQDVKLSKEIILELNSNDQAQAQSLAKEMCEELLANVVIEDYSFEILP